MRRRTLLAALAAAFCLPSTLLAQARADRFADAGEQRVIGLPDLTSLGVAKWATLGASAGAAVYGFITNGRADDAYRGLERVCASSADLCSQRLPDGAFADADLERRYQDVVALDRRARVALVASQVGVVASVVLFVLDLREDTQPPNIPYEPRGLGIEARADGALAIGWTLRR